MISLIIGKILLIENDAFKDLILQFDDLKTNFEHEPKLIDGWRILQAGNKSKTLKDVQSLELFGTKLVDYPKVRKHLLSSTFSSPDIILFSDQFVDISRWGLSHLEDDNLDLIDFWKANKNILHGYNARDHLDWPDANTLNEGMLKDLVSRLDEVNVNGKGIHDLNQNDIVSVTGQKGNIVDKKIVAIGTLPGNDNYVIKYNQKKSESGASLENNNLEYKAVWNNLSLSYELKKLIRYMDFIRGDFVNTIESTDPKGEIYKVLYKSSHSSSSTMNFKLLSAQRPGIHAEVLVADQLMKSANYSTLQQLANSGAKIVVRQKSKTGLKQMNMCPHCYFILRNLGLVIETN